MNDAGGYTNGFYIGQPKTLSKILSRYVDFHTYPEYPTYIKGDYEQVVRDSFAHHKVSRNITNIAFCKLRANHQLWIPPALQDVSSCSEQLKLPSKVSTRDLGSAIDIP